MKKFIFVFLLISTVVFAKEKDYSTVEFSFSLEKQVVPDIVIASFEVFAEGDNYNMALSRMKKIYNDFFNFLKTIFSEEEIKTQPEYSYSNTAKMLILVKTKEKEKVEKAIGYILSKNFPYKSGITISDIRFSVSKSKQKRVKTQLFKEALKEAREKQKIVNSMLDGSYKISYLKLNWSREKIRPYTREIMAMTKEIETEGLKISSGIQKIKLDVHLELKQPMFH